MHPRFKVGEKVVTYPGPYQIVGTIATILPSRGPGKETQYVISFDAHGRHGESPYQIQAEDRILPYEDPVSVENTTAINALKAEIDTLKARIENLIGENDNLADENNRILEVVDRLTDNERRIREILCPNHIET